MTLSRRSVLRSAAAASVATLPVAKVLAQPKAEFTYKYANNLPVAHPMNVRAKEMAAAILAETKGRVDIQIFPASQLGNDTDMLSQLRAGGIEFFTLSGLILSTLVPGAAGEAAVARRLIEELDAIVGPEDALLREREVALEPRLRGREPALGEVHAGLGIAEVHLAQDREDRDLAIGPLLVLGEVRIHRHQPPPQLGALGRVGQRRTHRDRPIPQPRNGFRVLPQVAPPRRVDVAAGVGRRDDQAIAVLQVDQRHRARLTGLAAGDGEQHRRIPRVLRGAPGMPSD